MPFRYSISLELEGRACVVVGGGREGEHKTRGLLSAGGAVTVISPKFSDGLQELARRGEVKLIRKRYSYGDLEGAFLAIAATGDPDCNREVFFEAEQRRVLLNSVDDIEHCHFAAPSTVRRGDLLIAISTGGKAPALAKRLRQDLTKQFGDEWGVLVDLLSDARNEALPDRDVDFATWAARWQHALDHNLVSLVRDGRTEEAKEIVRAVLADGAAPKRGRVSIIGAGPGDPRLITVRGKDLLDEADVVVYDRLVHPSLVDEKRAIYVGKEPGHNSVSQEEINALLVRLAREGNHVARLKGGDPFVFGRGAEEVDALAEAGVPFEVVPAPTSAFAVPASAGIPVTDRRYASSVAIVTGHCAEREIDWERLATAVDTIVVLMGVQSIGHIAESLMRAGRDPSTPAAVIERGTLPDQRVTRSHLSGLARAVKEAGVRPPAVVVVGDVVRLGASDSHLPLLKGVV